MLLFWSLEVLVYVKSDLHFFFLEIIVLLQKSCKWLNVTDGWV